MIKYSANSDTTFSVSGVGSVTGDAGSEELDYGSLLGALGGGSTAALEITRDITWDSILTDGESGSVENYLLSDNNL